MSKRKTLNSSRRKDMSDNDDVQHLADEIQARPQPLKKNNHGKRRIPAPSPAAPALTLTEALAPSSTASSNLSRKEAPAPVPAAEPQPSGMIDLGLPLPERYGFDRLVALVRDPRSIFSYWELDGSRMGEIRDSRGQAFIDACAWVLRIYRLNEGVAIDMEIEPSVGNWYIDVGGPGRYQLELALLSPDGEWISLLFSQIVTTPLTGPSDIIDEEWRLRPEDEEALARLLAELTADERGTSGMLGASRFAASFGVVSSHAFPGSSFSGRPVAGSWAFSMLGGSERVSGSGSGGFGWIVSPAGAHEPQFERPTMFAGPNWNTQDNLPRTGFTKSQQPHFKIKLPRRVAGVIAGKPSWPPADVNVAPAQAR